jgi:hypothetical protein
MTDLQTSLIAIGGAIVAGVISYNKWQEYKARKSMERAFSASPDDVLMRSGRAANEGGNERREPGFDLPRDSDSGTGVGSSYEDFAGTPGHASDLGSFKELPIDPLLDCSVALGLESPVRGEKILPVLQTLRHVGSKPVHFIGESADGGWESIGHGGIYTALRAGVQLANRGGALNELEYSEFVMRLRQVADELGAEPDIPDMIGVMSAARDLHQLVAEYDIQLSVNLQSNGAPWGITTLLTALERLGFDLRPDGRLVMPDGENGSLFSLSTNVTLAAETTPRLTLLLNMPCVIPERGGLGAMLACAKSLAARLDGTVVDDANQALSDAALGEIATQVDAFYDDMEAADIPAGSSRAMRLFN